MKTPLVINVLLHIDALSADGYRVTLCGIPDEAATVTDCLGVNPRIELYGRIFAAARDIPRSATVHAKVLGLVVPWRHWPYSNSRLPTRFDDFAQALDNVLDADTRFVGCEEAA